MPGRKIIFAFCLICLFSSVSRTQQRAPSRPKPASDASRAPQPVAPPPKPAADGPSLEVTMKFIQDKLNGIGRLRSTTRSGDEFVSYDAVELTNVVADPQRCTISYHRQDSTDVPEWHNDKQSRELLKPRKFDLVLGLKEVEKITVTSIEQALNETDKDKNTWTVRPPMFEVEVRNNSRKTGNTFIVDDEELANRLARAISHAVELCTPDKKPEPF